MKLVLLSLLVAGSAFATTPTTPTTPTTFNPTTDGKVNFEIWPAYDQITAPLQLLTLEKTKPELYTVTVNYNISPDTKIVDTTYWRTVYVNQFERPRLAEWLQCVVYDTESHTCGTLLGIDFKNFKARHKEMRAAIAANYKRATENKFPSLASVTFVNGTRYDLPLAYGQLLHEVNPLLPKEKQLTGMTKYETTKMYAVGNETGFGLLDPALEREFKRWIPNLVIEKVPANSKKGAELLTKTELQYVPAYIFDKASGNNAAVQRLTVAGRATITKTGYGYFDYKGKSTEVRFVGEEKPNTLDLWVMSECPFGVKAERAYQAAVAQKIANPKMKLNLRYIAGERKVNGKTTWTALHGDRELQENIRQLAIQKTWPDKLWAYLDARNADLNADWKTVATTAGLNPTEVEKVMPLGRKLMAQDIKDSVALKVSGSPTYLWQNRVILNTPEEFKATIGYNPTEVKFTEPTKSPTTRQPTSQPDEKQAAAPANAKCG